MRVLELTDNPQVDTHALKQCIENDPALTTRVLRVVNSSLFGLAREVSDLNQALALLGIKPLKLLVLGFSLPPGLFAGLTGDVLGRYWRRTLTKAIAAREINERLWHRPGDEAFIAGLLQDLGMLVLIQELGVPYIEFLEKVRQGKADLLAWEVRSLGFDHTLLTSQLLDRWGFPESLAQAVRWHGRDSHDSSPPCEPSPLGHVLRLAELLARLLVDGNSEALEELLASSGREHALSPGQLQELVARLEETVCQLADVLSLKLPKGLDYRDVLAQAQQRLADVATEAAQELIQHQHVQPPDADDQLLDQVNSLSAAMCRLSRPSSRGASAVGAERVQREGAAAEPAPLSPNAHALAAPAVACRTETTEPDPGLLGQLGAVVTACRQARCAVSLLLVELGDVDELVITWGTAGFGRLRRVFQGACYDLDHPGMICLPHGEAGLALILPDCDRVQAVHLANQLMDRMRRLAAIGTRERRPTLSVNAGVATVALPPKNFPPADLLQAAERCRNGSRASGGGVVKSIEIY